MYELILDIFVVVANFLYVCDSPAQITPHLRYSIVLQSLTRILLPTYQLQIVLHRYTYINIKGE